MQFKTVDRFDKEIKKLAKKYPNIKKDLVGFIEGFDELHQLSTTIQNSLFKARIKNSDKPKGKSGGYRTYYYIIEDETVYFLTIYDKGEKESINEKTIDELIKQEFN